MEELIPGNEKVVKRSLKSVEGKRGRFDWVYGENLAIARPNEKRGVVRRHSDSKFQRKLSTSQTQNDILTFSSSY